MVASAPALALLFISPVLWAHREGAGSQQSSGSHLGTSSESLLVASATAGAEASAAAAEAAFFEGMHTRLQDCQGVQNKRMQEVAKNVNNQESVKKMENCINSIASFAEKTRKQRASSMEANKKYAEIMVLAKRTLQYLTKQTDTHEQKFNEFKASEGQHLNKIEDMLRMAQSTRGGSLLQNANGPLAQDYWRPMAGFDDARQAPMMGSQAAMFTPNGQNFGVPGLVGRRPSLLQAALAPHADSGDLQAQLDREAEKLEESDEQDLQGGGAPGS